MTGQGFRHQKQGVDDGDGGAGDEELGQISRMGDVLSGFFSKTLLDRPNQDEVQA